MKQLIIKLIYPLLDKLPEKWATNIKIIGCVLTGYWRMDPFLHFDHRGVKSEAEALAFFADMDDESLAEIKRIYAHADLYIAEERRSFFFYNWGAVKPPAWCPTKKETQPPARLSAPLIICLPAAGAWGRSRSFSIMA